MTDQGYHNRIYAVEWHGRLWQVYGAPLALCDAMISYCGDCVRADYYKVPRPEPPDDEDIVAIQAYFDDILFQPFQEGDLVSFE